MNAIFELMLVFRTLARQTYKQCFVGKDAVKWLTDNSDRVTSSDEAVGLGNLLMGERNSTQLYRRLGWVRV